MAFPTNKPGFKHNTLTLRRPGLPPVRLTVTPDRQRVVFVDDPGLLLGFTAEEAIRVAAFLARFHREHNFETIQTENAGSKARRERKETAK